MKIAIISDIHENFHNLILALQEMEKRGVDQILCLGDLINPGIGKVLATQSIPVFLIWGNNDGDRVEITLASKRANSQLSVSARTFDFLTLDGKKLFLSHYDDLAKPMAQSGLYDAVFFGHNHDLSHEKIGNCWVLNPGELAASKTKKATFMIYDTQAHNFEIINLEGAVTLKTPLMEAYFKEHGPKMNLRSKLLKNDHSLIPTSSPVYQTLFNCVNTAKAVVFSGLPGVGKSLYINAFKQLAASEGKEVTVIQWDIARKAFETAAIAQYFPMGDGIVHNGVKLSAGEWLLATIQDWLSTHQQPEELLLIEAPLVGHRFIELAQIQTDTVLEAFFKSKAFQIIVPIPSKKVRAKIEVDRAAQQPDDAKVWTGAKPSVMLLLWKMICGIANEFGRTISMEGQPPYDPEVYEFVFSRILKHRHFIPLPIHEIFEVDIHDQEDLHKVGSLAADEDTANQIAQAILDKYPTAASIDAIVAGWYLT